MNITDVKIDGFGVWSDLTLAQLSPQCTVFYGPNEAGKTTLLEFIRAVFYGFFAGPAQPATCRHSIHQPRADHSR